MRNSNSSQRPITVSFHQCIYISFFSVLSNPDRKKHYDRFGTVPEDGDGEAAFSEMFESMFGGGFSMFGDDDDMEEFTRFMESDTKMMRNMMRDLGKNARMRGKRRKGGAVGGGSSAGGIHINMNMGPSMDMMDDMLNFFMMPGMAMGMGASKKKKPAKKASKEAEGGDGWETEEDELDEEDGIKSKKK